MDAAAAGITTVIWATGFRYNFDWVKLPFLGAAGEPLQQRGVSSCPGFYFLGLRRMFNLRSNLFEGVGEDAAYIAEHINARAPMHPQVDRSSEQSGLMAAAIK